MIAQKKQENRLLKFLQAPKNVQETIDKILDGKITESSEPVNGPLLMNLTAAAKFLGVSRASCWRLRKKGRLPSVKILDSYYIRRVDLEALATGERNVA